MYLVKVHRKGLAGLVHIKQLDLDVLLRQVLRMDKHTNSQGPALTRGGVGVGVEGRTLARVVAAAAARMSCACGLSSLVNRKTRREPNLTALRAGRPRRVLASVGMERQGGRVGQSQAHLRENMLRHVQNTLAMDDTAAPCPIRSSKSAPPAAHFARPFACVSKSRDGCLGLRGARSRPAARPSSSVMRRASGTSSSCSVKMPSKLLGFRSFFCLHQPASHGLRR